MSGASFFSAANAAFVGAKTVNGPLPFSVFTRPACFTSATSVEKRLSPAATPTIVALCADGSLGAAVAPTAIEAVATSAPMSTAMRAFTW